MKPALLPRNGFTLLEIMIVLAIGAVLVGLSVPYITGMLGETQLREPARELQSLAKLMRSRAMTERVSYEIVFTAEGFYGQRCQLYAAGPGDEESAATPPSSVSPQGGAETSEPDEASLREEAGGGEEPSAGPVTPGGDASAGLAAAGGDEADASVTGSEVFPEYRFKSGTVPRLLFWGRSLWIEPGKSTQEQEQEKAPAWVFAPSGLCNPLRVEFRTGEAWIELCFNPLTADVQEERYQFPD